MCPFLQETDNAVAPEELPLVLLPLFLSHGAITEHSHRGDPGEVKECHYKVPKRTLLPYGNIE